MRERDGRIEIDLADPPPETVIADALAALVESFDDHEYDRMAREIARAEKAGADPHMALTHAIRATADRFEFGASHALPASADWLALSKAVAGDDPAKRLVAVLEGVAHFAWDSRRAPRYPYAAGVADWDAEAFRAAVEAEDEAAALAHVRGALKRGFGWGDIEPAFARAALDHYADFGHSAIYSYKTRQLVAALDPDAEGLEAILSLLTRSLVMATREDLIPEFKAYAPALERYGEGAEGLPAVETLATGSVRKVLAAIADSGAEPLALYDRLVEAAAWQMLHFDLAWDRQTDGSFSQNVGWLDFTHALTFANAVRKLAERTPEIWPAGLLQIGCFLGRNAAYIDRSLDTAAWRVDDLNGFYRAGLEGLFDHDQFELIVSAHLLKLTVALDEERRERPDAPWHGTAAAALNRLLASPLRRKHPLRTAKQSLAFVAAEG